MSNYFVVLSTYNYSIVKSIIDQYSITDSYIIDPYNYLDDTIDNKINIDLDINEKNESIIRLFDNQFKKAKLSKYIIQNCRIDNLFIPHMSDIVTNTLSFNSMCNKIIIYEDGILPYYENYFSKKKILINYFKKIICFIFGLKYNVLNKYIPEDDDVISEIYLKYYGIYDGNINNVNSINFNEINYEAEDVNLLLGQESYIRKVGQKRYFEVLQKIISIIGDDNKLIYKPHRMCGKKELSKIKKIIPKENILLDDTPIEDFICDLKPKAIYSFNSSALLNLRFILPNKINIYSCFAFSNTMKQKFKRIGIKEIKCS